MIFTKIHQRTDIRHFLIWFAITIYITILDPPQGSFIGSTIVTIFIILNYVFVYYSISLFILERFWKINYGKAFILIICVLALFIGFDYIILFIIAPSVDVVNPYPIALFLKNDFLIFNIIALAAATYYFNRQIIKKINEQNKSEKLLILRELNFLKNQFNSHITMNFLNFCYSNVIDTLPRTADAIELFSKILRYTLNTNVNEKILLDKEIEYLNNYIELQKLLTSEVYVEFKRPSYNKNCIKIVPRIFITLVENAFKHGIYNDKNHPIVILINCANNSIDFTIKNQKALNSSKQVSGIGYSNMNQVLDIYYKSKYTLDILDRGDSYKCCLSIFF